MEEQKEEKAEERKEELKVEGPKYTKQQNSNWQTQRAFQIFSPRAIYYEYDGKFPRPKSYKMNGTRVTRLLKCHRSLGVIEGSIVSYEPGGNKGIFRIGKVEHPFRFHQVKSIPDEPEQLIGKEYRFTMRPLVLGFLPVEAEPERFLPELRLTSLRESLEPEPNYVEIMGRIQEVEEDSFFVQTFDYNRQSIDYVPFVGSYPYPDEVGGFAWLKGRFNPETRGLHLVDAQSIAFLEPEEGKEVVERMKNQDQRQRGKRERRRARKLAESEGTLEGVEEVAGTEPRPSQENTEQSSSDA